MAWIESHQELFNHPKTKRLMRSLGISLVEAIGHLHIFWWWALEYAEDGDVSPFSPQDIADAAMWNKDASSTFSMPERDASQTYTFYEAMLDSGFFEKKGERILIHDWMEYAGKLVKKRRQNRDSKRRARGFTEQNDIESGMTQSDSSMTQSDVCLTGGVYSNSNSNQKIKDLKDSPHSLSQTGDERSDTADQNTEQVTVMADEFGGPSSDEVGRRKRVTTAVYSAEFERFWSIYPRKVEKQTAFRCWKTRQSETMPDGAKVTSAILLQCAQNYADECRQTGTLLRYVKHGSTFLGPDRPFLDYIHGPAEPEAIPSRASPRPTERRYEPYQHEAPATPEEELARDRALQEHFAQMAAKGG